MEVYAGMIDNMDEQIGRVLEHLRQSGDYDNRLVVFMSDNRPSKTSIADYLALGGEGAAFFEQFDNSAGNKGLPGSSTDIGPGWAYAAATPLRLFKGYVAQGGIQVPAVIKLPGSMTRHSSPCDNQVNLKGQSSAVRLILESRCSTVQAPNYLGVAQADFQRPEHAAIPVNCTSADGAEVNGKSGRFPNGTYLEILVG